ncbi:hypothetical protein ACET3X_004706 [Alternaria dauci]|uniref:RING-type domain-containing protein n=1 Tax=Alternaria dauci TaxID=48095 RepID=A0ABR3UI59_9PLEO
MATPPPTMHPVPSSTDEPPKPTMPETPADSSPASKPPCPCPTCTLAAESGLDIWVTPGGGSSNSPQKAHYVPPRPDADTFADQQAFLDSLASISIDSVGEDSKKCPTCWKPYGEEADPGYDNSEQPVRLKCRHVFGDKCLRDTFGLPTTSTVTLEPLAFGPGSRGRQLGQRLHAYWQKSKDREQDEYASAFTQMANVRPESTTERFGMYSHFLACLSLGRKINR